MATPAGDEGYWLARSDGSVLAFGDAESFGSLRGVKLAHPIVGIAASASGGYWLVSSDGRVFPFGNARFYGSMAGVKLARPIVGIAATEYGQGYWLVASDGGVFAFGKASFYGSLAGVKLAGPIVGIAPAPFPRRGYWLVGSDGGVFAFRGANFYGSLGGVKLARPVVGIKTTLHGYYLVASDGGVFAFGDAPFFGSLGGKKLARPIVGMDMAVQGYYLVGSGGDLFTFGYAVKFGTEPPSRIGSNFKPPVPGAPLILAKLDNTGLHFKPSHIASGIYNVAFSDTRTDRIPRSDVAVHIYVSGPGISELSVHAGQIGGGLLCWGAVSEGVTVGGSDLTSGGIAVGGGLTIDQSPACETPVT